MVFLHGYPLTHEIFEPQLETMARDHHAILLDLPGYGRAAEQPVPESLSGFADRVHEFLAERFSTPVALLGHSFGGYIALELMRKHPEQLDALILANTRSTPDGTEAREARLATAKRLEDPAEHLDAGAVAKTLVAPATFESNRALVDRLRTIVSGVPSRTVVATLRAIAGRSDLTPVLSRIQVPTLVIWGEEDRLIPPAQSQSMVSLLPGGRGIGLPGAGHLPSLETPDAFSRAVLELLRRSGSSSEP